MGKHLQAIHRKLPVRAVTESPVSVMNGTEPRSRTGAGAPAIHGVSPFLRMLRPVQWTKNAVVLAGVIFSGEADEPAQLVRAILAVLAFCAVSSAMYIVNDWHDRDRDRLHPVKRRRPIASGAIGGNVARAAAAMLFVLGIAISIDLSWSFTVCIVGYAVLTTTYTYVLKNYAGMDVLSIASGFLLRALGGALAVEVPLSPWLFLCTFLLALFLGFGKRRNELLLFNGTAGEHRNALQGYTRRQLDWAVSLTAVASVVSYLMYSLATNSARTDNALLATVPFVALAISRYMILVFKLGLGGAPEVLLVRDRLLQIFIVGWGASTLIVLNLP